MFMIIIHGFILYKIIFYIDRIVKNLTAWKPKVSELDT